jgi:hypothetical protein
MITNTTYRYIIYFLILCISTIPFCGNASAQIIEWDKEISIDNKTLIDTESIVKVKPGTKINFIGFKSRLNIMGHFLVSGSEKNPAVISIPNLVAKSSPTSIRKKAILKFSENLKELEIYPYSADTKEIVDELRAFRYQYAFVWTVLMGICFYLVLNRTIYW